MPAGKRGRLSRAAEFERVYRQGRSVSDRCFVLHAFPRAGEEEPEGEPRLGLSVGRRVGGAVERNRVKRLIREAFRELGSVLPAGQDVVVVARADAHDLAEREGLEGVRTALAALADKLAGRSAAAGPASAAGTAG